MKNPLQLGGTPFSDKPMWAVVIKWVMSSIFAKFAWSRYRSSETRGTWLGVSFETIGASLSVCTFLLSSQRVELTLQFALQGPCFQIMWIFFWWATSNMSRKKNTRVNDGGWVDPKNGAAAKNWLRSILTK